MEASSAINAPHIDDPKVDDAEAFFGGEPDAEETAPVAQEQEQEPAAAEPEPEPQAAATAAEPEKQRGPVEREYIVFQRVALTAATLKALLAQVESGEAGRIRTAYFELHRQSTRNDKQAISEAYRLHRESLGDSCDLAAVSARSFKDRHIEPEEVPAERRVRIT